MFQGISISMNNKDLKGVFKILQKYGVISVLRQEMWPFRDEILESVFDFDDILHQILNRHCSSVFMY